MAVELLLKNISDVHPDPKIDRISSLKRGDLTFAKQIPHDDWNEYETLPEFSRLIVSDANISGIQQYMEPWYLELDFEVLNYDDVNDIYNIRMFCTTSGIGGLGIIEPDVINPYLENWGLSISGHTLNQVFFEADMGEVFKSQNFWGGVAKGLVFSHLDFDLPSKTHTLKLSYSGYTPYITSRTSVRNGIEILLDLNNATIDKESIYGQLMEIVIPSLIAVQKFKADVTQKSKKIIYARRYYIGNGAMNAIETYMQNNNGDAMTTDKATLLTYLNDRLTE